MGLRSRLVGWLARGDESLRRAYSGFQYAPAGAYHRNWWQLGQMATEPADSSAVYACVSIIAQEVSRLDVRHWRSLPDGGREEILQSPAARVLRRPNHYQTRSDFWLYLMASQLTTGRTFGTARRDGAGRISAIYPRPPYSGKSLVDDRTGAVFYQFSPLQYAPDLPATLPARDVLNVRMFTEPGRPLEGISPLRSAAYSIQHGLQIQAQQRDFFANAARPDGVLKYKGNLTSAQVKALQQQWREAFSGSNAGQTAVLEGDFEWESLTVSPQDLELIATLNWTVDDVCRVFRVPLWMVARVEQATYNNAETQARSFVMQTLGFWVKHLELGLGELFNLPPSEYLEFDLERGLLRSEFGARVKGLREGVQGGIYSPNEARAIEGLPPVDGGDEVLVQMQMQPVDQAGQGDDQVDEQLEEQPAPTPLLDELVAARSQVEDLERELALQRMEHAHEVGALRTNLELFQRRASE